MSQALVQPITASTARKRALLVLGMHRSGTSAVAGVAWRLGADLPATLLQPAADNPTGFFEATGIIGVNDWILHAGESAWYDCLRFGEARFPPAVQTMALALINVALLSEFPRGSLLLIKDPRLCLLQDLWMPVLDAVKAAPSVLLVLRHPSEVIASLAQRDGCPALVSAALWLQYMLSAEYATRRRPRAVIAYGSLLSDWRNCLDRAADQADVVWPVNAATVAAEMPAFLDQGLRHHAPAVWPPQLRSLANWLEETYQVMQAMVASPGDAALLLRLDAVRTEFTMWRERQGRAQCAALLQDHPLRAQAPGKLPVEWLRLANTLARQVIPPPASV